MDLKRWDIMTEIINDWRGSKTIRDSIQYIYSTQLYADVTLTISDGDLKKDFKVHTLFLKMASEVFEIMFNGLFRESLEMAAQIEDVSPEVFDLFLQFVYFGTASLNSVEQAVQLFELAHRYLSINLQNYCLNYVTKNLNCSNACFCLEFAEFYLIEELKINCLQVIRDNTKAILSSESFASANVKTIESILKQTALSVTEFELFKSIENWINYTVSNQGEDVKTSICESLIPKILYFGMTPREFMAGPMNSGLLTMEQSVALLGLISSTNCTYQIPKGFSNKIRIIEGQFVISNVFHLNLNKSLQYEISNILYRQIYFTVDHNIKIVGLNIMSRVEREWQSGVKYNEDLVVDIGIGGECLSTTEFTGEIEYWSSIFLPLTRPINLSRGRRHWMIVRLKDRGKYRTYSLNGLSVQSDGVIFNFTEYPLCPPQLPVASIYFTK